MNTDELIRGNSHRTVLVVEDEAVNRELLGFILSSNFDVLYAEDGQEGLDVLQANRKHISLIMLDINMPHMNGIEFLRVVEADDELRQVPVIVLTSDKDAELDTLRLGAVDFITKPYDMPEIILARAQRIIQFVEDRQIIQDVEHDELTNLYNRSFFYEYSRRLMDEPGCAEKDMLALDIDHFRLINEVYGKAFGDEMLVAVAEGVRSVLGRHFGIGCRGSADQFFVLIDHSDDYESLYALVRDSVQKAAGQARVRVRMGVYKHVDVDKGIEWYADAARSACNSLRGTYTQDILIYDDALHQRELYEDRLIADMDTALREKQFVVHYQPKYNIRGDKPVLTSAEALVRWIHPEMGFISPGAFIPLFEENGLILKLDDYVWKSAAAQIRDWQERFGVTVPVSVNLSRMDFFDGTLKDRLLTIVQESGISVKDLMLEVTESAYSQNMDQMMNTVRDLRQAGFMIEMDDFGSGYSSLNMLCLMPVDALKIDMKFVQNLLKSGTGYRMVELVVNMAQCLGVPAIVEGVEDEQQYQLMKQVGCDVVQGYYFSRPLDAAAFEEKLLNKP